MSISIVNRNISGSSIVNRIRTNSAEVVVHNSNVAEDSLVRTEIQAPGGGQVASANSCAVFDSQETQQIFKGLHSNSWVVAKGKDRLTPEVSVSEFLASQELGTSLVLSSPMLGPVGTVFHIANWNGVFGVVQKDPQGQEKLLPCLAENGAVFFQGPNGTAQLKGSGREAEPTLTVFKDGRTSVSHFHQGLLESVELLGKDVTISMHKNNTELLGGKVFYSDDRFHTFAVDPTSRMPIHAEPSPQQVTQLVKGAKDVLAEFSNQFANLPTA